MLKKIVNGLFIAFCVVSFASMAFADAFQLQVVSGWPKEISYQNQVVPNLDCMVLFGGRLYLLGDDGVSSAIYIVNKDTGEVNNKIPLSKRAFGNYMAIDKNGRFIISCGSSVMAFNRDGSQDTTFYSQDGLLGYADITAVGDSIFTIFISRDMSNILKKLSSSGGEIAEQDIGGADSEPSIAFSLPNKLYVSNGGAIKQTNTNLEPVTTLVEWQAPLQNRFMDVRSRYIYCLQFNSTGAGQEYYVVKYDLQGSKIGSHYIATGNGSRVGMEVDNDSYIYVIEKDPNETNNKICKYSQTTLVQPVQPIVP